MLTLDLWKKAFPEKSFSFIADKIADGADGEVFELKADPNKVIKISILIDLDFNGLRFLKNKCEHISNVLTALMQDNAPFAKVFKYHNIGSFKRLLSPRDNLIIEQDYILYYYTMEKCQKLSEDEKKVFHSIVSHEDRGLMKNFSPLKLRQILFGLSRGLDFDVEKVIIFYESLLSSKIIHNDLHPRNIMKDKDGNFKLVDFDRCDL